MIFALRLEGHSRASRRATMGRLFGRFCVVLVTMEDESSPQI